jgi:hypothetical protein
MSIKGNYKMSEQYYYKAIFKDYINSKQDYYKYISFFRNPMEVEYTTNTLIKAPEFNGVVCPIFAFKKLENAKLFLKKYSRIHSQDKLFKCTGKLYPHDVDYVVGYMPQHKDEIVKFWNKSKENSLPQGFFGLRVPDGTVLLTEITLLQEIEVK